MNLTIQELQRQIQRGPGLVFGPQLSTNGAREPESLAMLRKTFPGYDNDKPVDSYLDYADLILAKGEVSELEVRRTIEDHFQNSSFANPQLSTIVKPKWTAIISLAADDFFRQKFSESIYNVPSKWSVSTIAEPSSFLPLVTIPYYALMGDIRDKREASSLAVSTSMLLKRQRSWQQMLSNLPHILKSDPIIFLGTEHIIDRVCAFINELLRLSPQIPKRLIFLEHDVTPSSALFKNLTHGNFQVEVASCSLADLGNSLSAQNLAIYSLPLFAEATKLILDPRILEDIEDQVAYVPRLQELRVNRDERHRLLDALFRPTHLDWNPYALHLEFKRDICATVVERVKALFLQRGRDSRIIHIKGEAGIGKTVVCRSVAFELAQKGLLCFWIKRSYGELSGSRFDAVVKKLNEALRKLDIEVVFILDDPISSRVTLAEAANALARSQFRWVLVVASKMTDDVSVVMEGQDSLVEEGNAIELPTNFSQEELTRLPEYLVSLGVASSLEAAKKMMLAPGVKHSKDVLCSLWYLLPQTHGAIEDSLVNEYRRLGETEQMVRHFADAAGSKSVAKAAYELVTTTSGFDGAALPVEVLVSALGISYSQWSQQCTEKKPLWGLLYDEQYPSAETYAYRTRNQVVTDILLRELNKGTSGHTGEYRCLLKLISSCTSASPQYKQFLRDILITRRELIEHRFTYIQAMALYDAALKAFPKSLGNVEHQRAIVMRHLGGDAGEVYEVLTKLIARSRDRSIPDQDSPDNLHTSAAATLKQLITDKKLDPVTTADSVFEHISAAIAYDQFSIHAYHVHAATLLTMAQQLRSKDKIAFLLNLERASRIADRGLSVAQKLTVPCKAGHTPKDSVGMFQQLKQDILLTYSDLEEALVEADALFNKTQIQTGYAFVARALLAKAIDENRGRTYNKLDELLHRIFMAIAAAGKDVCDELILTRIELVINWQVIPGKGPVCWERFEADLIKIRKNALFEADYLWNFYLGVAEYNQGKFPDAEGRFQWLRSANIPWHLRNLIQVYYLGNSGSQKVFEGKVSHGPSERYIFSAELGNDVLVRKDEFRARPDEIKHFIIGFSFLGPIAIERPKV